MPNRDGVSLPPPPPSLPGNEPASQTLEKRCATPKQRTRQHGEIESLPSISTAIHGGIEFRGPPLTSSVPSEWPILHSVRHEDLDPKICKAPFTTSTESRKRCPPRPAKPNEPSQAGGRCVATDPTLFENRSHRRTSSTSGLGTRCRRPLPRETPPRQRDRVLQFRTRARDGIDSGQSSGRDEPRSSAHPARHLQSRDRE